MTWLWLPTYSPHLNLIARLGKLVKADCLHGRYYPKFGPFKQAIIDCLADTNGRHQAQLRRVEDYGVWLSDVAAIYAAGAKAHQADHRVTHSNDPEAPEVFHLGEHRHQLGPDLY
ncbi:MAG: hypothetical protein M0Z53_08425 [Thermaerobacter sp.]|nr:hypothetical protein [Thermaerobacter sp.]